MSRLGATALAVVAGALLPAAAAAQGQQGRPVVGGGSFNTAPVLGPGTYSDTIITSGEATYYRVSIKKGQRLTLRATFDSSGFETDSSSPGYVPGLNQVLYGAKIYTPLRQELIDDDEKTTGGQEVDSVSVRGKLALGYEELLSSYTDDDFNGPGFYYIGLATNDLLGNNAGSPVEVPTTLTVRVEGQAQPSSRNYTPRLITERAPRASSGEPTGTRLGGVDVGARASADDRGGLSLGSVIALAAFGLLGGLALGAVAGAGRGHAA